MGAFFSGKPECCDFLSSDLPIPKSFFSKEIRVFSFKDDSSNGNDSSDYCHYSNKLLLFKRIHAFYFLSRLLVITFCLSLLCMMFPRLYSLILIVLCFGVVKCSESELNLRPSCSNAVIQDELFVNSQGSVERVQSSVNSVQNSSWYDTSNQRASEVFISPTADLSPLNEDEILQTDFGLSQNDANDPLLISLHALVSIRGTDGDLQDMENDYFNVNYNPSSSNVVLRKRVVFDDSDSDSEDDIVNCMINSMVDELLESDIGH